MDRREGMAAAAAASLLAAQRPSSQSVLVEQREGLGVEKAGRKQHTRSLRLHVRYSASSKKGTLEALEQEFRRERSKEILQLLKEALQLLDRQSFDTDPETYATLLKGCTDADSLPAGQFIHQHILTNGSERNTYLCNFLVEMYGKCGAIEEARFMFDCMDQPNVFSWTIIIAAYAQRGQCKEAQKLFLQMRLKRGKPNKFTFSTILATCSNPTAVAQGESIHASAIHDGFDSDVVVGTALVNMYGKCRSAKDAGLVFEKMHQRDTISWNAMIAVHVQHGESKAALLLFHQMMQDGLKPNKITFASVLGACGSPDCLAQGEMIHAKVVGCGFLFDIIIGNALIDMYGKCGKVGNARIAFDKMHCRDVVSWTSMIAVYAQHPREALELYNQMLSTGLKPNEFTFASILTACANLRALGQGQVVHHFILEAGLGSNIVVSTALIGMYGKCMNLSDARWVFNCMHGRDLVLWNAMIGVFAQHGLGKEALDSLLQMRQEGQTPDEITFTSVLSACSRAGLVDEGCHIYVSMSKNYNLVPSMEHCGCMVDLFGRAALLKEAEDFIDSMPLKPNAVVWEIFLNACRVHSDRECGELAGKGVLELTAKTAAPW